MIGFDNVFISVSKDVEAISFISYSIVLVSIVKKEVLLNQIIGGSSKIDPAFPVLTLDHY